MIINDLLNIGYERQIHFQERDNDPDFYNLGIHYLRIYISAVNTRLLACVLGSIHL